MPNGKTRRKAKRIVCERTSFEFHCKPFDESGREIETFFVNRIESDVGVSMIDDGMVFGGLEDFEYSKITKGRRAPILRITKTARKRRRR